VSESEAPKRVVAIVQARMTSSRLPGKSLLDIAGKPLLQHVLERLQRAPNIDEVVVATTDEPVDRPLVDAIEKLGFRAVRGDRDDVLARYLQAAHVSQADVIVRVTGDCPLVDPDLSADVVDAYFHENVDYASNWIVRTFPRGADTEAFSIESFERVATVAHEPYEREHATPYYYYHPQEFRMASVEAVGDLHRPDYRLCVDTEEDLRLIREIYDRLGRETNDFPMLDVVRLLNREPALPAINAHIQQKKTR